MILTGRASRKHGQFGKETCPVSVRYGVNMFQGLAPAYKNNAVYPSNYVYKYPKAGERNSTVSVHVYDIMDAIGRDFDLQGYEEHTVNGLLMHILGRTPVGGDEVNTDDVSIRVVSMDGRRAKECRVIDHRAPPA